MKDALTYTYSKPAPGEKVIRALWASTPSKCLRYGDSRRVRQGSTHSVTGKIERCYNGLHASPSFHSFVDYVPDTATSFWIVDLWGDMDGEPLKVAARYRRYIREFSFADLIRGLFIDDVEAVTATDQLKLIKDARDDNKELTVQDVTAILDEISYSQGYDFSDFLERTFRITFIDHEALFREICR